MSLTFRNILFLALLILIITYFLIELFHFKEKIITAENYPNPENTNIVILTGGTNRIKDGFDIINKFDEKSKYTIKILVSGTGKGFTKLSLQNMLSPDFDLKLIKCCVELDAISQNTYSNAKQTLKWSTKNNIKEFILITSNYHMPRSILEFKNKMPNIRILTYPIKPRKHEINNWLNSFETFSLIFYEFCKFIISNIRINILKFDFS
ncbi:MAG: YdcF family protein [Alphaproteobacteria bacterium]|nr:YdcF family protein [Alphaproteobacteria bacterium]